MTDGHEWLSLGPEEKVVWSGQPRLRRLLPIAAVVVPFLLVGIGVAIAGLVSPELTPTLLVTAGGLVVALVGVVVLGVPYARTVNTDYVLTTRNVYRKTGVLSTSVTRVGIEAIQNTQLKKHVLGAIFDYGTVAISTAGSRGVDLRITDLNDPEALRSALRQRMAAVNRGDEHSSRSPIDEATLETIAAEFRALRGAAERLERGVTGS
jgi:uncharacterized membrane protein YdbT with pleckstrin-like domain